MSKTLHSICLCLFIVNGFAQSYTTIKGKVIDARNNQPLEYASIHLEKVNQGTISNAQGAFEFHISESALEGNFIVSFVGYENFMLPVGQIVDLSPITIKMNPKTVLLSEVTVTAASLTAKEVVEKAVKNIKTNYPSTPIQMECFFREIEWENEKCVQVTEAAIQLYDKKYNTKRNSFQEDINTQAVRRSLSYRQIEGFNDLGTAVVDLIENNDVRYQKGIIKTKNKEYNLDSISFYNDRPVYVISASNRLDRATLIIDLESLAFIKINLERRKRSIKGDPYYFRWDYGDSLKLGRVMFKYQLEFRETNNIMYPTYMMEEEIAHVYDPETKEISILKKERLEMVVNEIITDERAGDFPKERITRKYQVPVGAYDEAFWKHYNTLKLNPLEKQAISDLEKEMSINEQFKVTK